MHLFVLGMRYVATVVALQLIMTFFTYGSNLAISAAAIAAEALQCDAANAVALPTPGMSSSLSFSPAPCSVEVGPLGRWYIDAVLSGLALQQSHPMDADESGTIDMSNGQLIIQKIDGPIQFSVQAGTYAIPALGLRYSHLGDSSDASNLYGYVPQTYLKLAPTDTFSVQIGKLPTSQLAVAILTDWRTQAKYFSGNQMVTQASVLSQRPDTNGHTRQPCMKDDVRPLNNL